MANKGKKQSKLLAKLNKRVAELTEEVRQLQTGASTAQQAKTPPAAPATVETPQPTPSKAPVVTPSETDGGTGTVVTSTPADVSTEVRRTRSGGTSRRNSSRANGPRR
jgi:delta 1-pyrroline-5-carboxylate dehydrogenase